MPLLSKPSAAAFTSLFYITTGALLDVWTGIWYVYLQRHPPQYDGTWYWCYGFMLTGLTLMAIGFGLGRIGRSARHAELPPSEVTPAEANAELNAAARAPIVAPVNPAAQAIGQVAPNPTAGFVPANGQPAGVAAAPAVAQPAAPARHA